MTQENSSQFILDNYKDFLRIISHDFNAPLRQLDSFVNLLATKIEPRMDEEEKLYIEFINKSLWRLNIMQKSLLELSRVATNEEAPIKVESLSLVESALNKLEKPIKEHSAIITHENLPAFTVVESQLETVFFHLIENALTYHSDDNNERKIHISSIKDNNNIIFTVEDNGIGIEDRYHTDIFDMFRRLHSESNYAGHIGAGLSITKSIIEKHSGKIWIENSGNNGTKISFSLPK